MSLTPVGPLSLTEAAIMISLRVSERLQLITRSLFIQSRAAMRVDTVDKTILQLCLITLLLRGRSYNGIKLLELCVTCDLMNTSLPDIL